VFRVPTYVAPSGIAGMGVFTPHFIPAGTVLWVFTPGVDLVLAPEALNGIAEPLQTMLRTYCFETSRGEFVLCGDHARFMNHAFDPNCDDSGERTVALRDIQPGEELTCDYRQFDAESARTGLEGWRRSG
jgi:SET domain-containing protein